MSFAILDTPSPEARPRPVAMPGVRSRRSWDYYAFAVWVYVTFIQFPGDQFILYPLALYFAYAAWRNQTRILTLMRQAWVLLLFPVWCLLSVLWAVAPMDAFTNALYVSLTVLICFQVAVSLTPRQVLYSVLLAASAIILNNLFAIYGPAGDPTGLFASKNAMGKNMVVAFTVAFAVALDSASRPLLRLFAATIAGLAAYSAFISDSATAVLLVLGLASSLIGLQVFVSGGLLRPSRLGVVFVAIGLVGIVASFTVPNATIDPVEATLEAFGKDRTLTGRTELWEYARDQIEERPLLGVGAGGFWRYWASPLVRKIYEDFHQGARGIFNFHSGFYEIAVHQGYIGLAFAGIMSVWAAFWLMRGALVLGTMPQLYFFAHALAVGLRFLTESDFLKPFVIFHMLFWIVALLAVRQILYPEMDEDARHRER